MPKIIQRLNSGAGDLIQPSLTLIPQTRKALSLLAPSAYKAKTRRTPISDVTAMMPHRTPFGARVLTGCPVYLSAGGTSHSAVLLTQTGHGQHGSPLCCLQMGPDTRRFPDTWENLVQKTETRTDASPLATTCLLSFFQGIYNLKSHRLFLTNTRPTVLLFPCLTYDSLTVAGSQASPGG